MTYINKYYINYDYISGHVIFIAFLLVRYTEEKLPKNKLNTCDSRKGRGKQKIFKDNKIKSIFNHLCWKCLNLSCCENWRVRTFLLWIKFYMMNIQALDSIEVDKIATLRIIVKQTVEWLSSLYINFIDFKKPFDSVNRDGMWHC